LGDSLIDLLIGDYLSTSPNLYIFDLNSLIFFSNSLFCYLSYKLDSSLSKTSNLYLFSKSSFIFVFSLTFYCNSIFLYFSIFSLLLASCSLDTHSSISLNCPLKHFSCNSLFSRYSWVSLNSLRIFFSYSCCF